MILRKPAGGRPLLIVQAMIRKNTGQYLAIKRAEEVETGTWSSPEAG